MFYMYYLGIFIKLFILLLAVSYVLKILVPYIYYSVKFNKIFKRHVIYDCKINNVDRIANKYRENCIRENIFNDDNKRYYKNFKKLCRLHYKYIIFIKKAKSSPIDNKIFVVLHDSENELMWNDPDIMKKYIMDILIILFKNDDLIKKLYLGLVNDKLMESINRLDEEFPNKTYRKYFRHKIDKADTIIQVIGFNDFRGFAFICSVVYILFYMFIEFCLK